MPIKQKFVWVHRREKSYSGIGENKVKTTGKRSLPVAMKLKYSGLILPQFLQSHEQPGKHPLLLSDECQAKLGFVKDMREGKVYLKDYDDEIEVFRDRQSGLKVICISHFPTTDEGMKARYFVEKTGSHNVHEKIREYESKQSAIQNAQVLRTPSADRHGDGLIIQAPTLVAHMQHPAKVRASSSNRWNKREKQMKMTKVKD
jgi:hypothetical protein